MFIDIDNGILFVQNPKAAGTSIREALAAYKGVDKTFNKYRIKHDHDNKVGSHSFAYRLRSHPMIADHYDDMFSFGVVRNPWERAVSLWEWSKLVDGGQTFLRHGMWNLADRKKDQACNEAVRKGFEWWLTFWVSRYEWNPFEYIGVKGAGAIFEFNQSDWFEDKAGQQIVTKIYRMDQLAKLEVDLSKRLGMPIKFEKTNVTEHGPYRKYYNDDTRKWIAEHFAKDINQHKFTF